MDLEQLLKPIASAHGPCGEDLVFSAEFDEIQEARRFDDPSLSQGEWITDIKEADWPAVIRLCKGVLTDKSKDLRIAAWLTEALCKQEGLAGLAAGYELLGQLTADYWNDIHPLPEDGDFEQRTGLFDWLANQTTRLIRETPVTRSAKGRFSLTDYESARAASKNSDPHSGAVLAVSLDAFEAAVKDTSRSYFTAELAAAQRLKAAMLAAQTVLDNLMGEYSPALGPCFDALDDVCRFFQRHGGGNGDVGHAASAGEPSASGATATVAAGVTVGEVIAGIHQGAVAMSGPVYSREQALRQLQEIAEFFRRTEPHSPVAYLAQKAAKWGTMPLHEWLRAVVKDGGALMHMEELLGVEPPAGDSY